MKTIKKALRASGGDRALAYNTLTLTKAVPAISEAEADSSSDNEWDITREEDLHHSDTSGGTTPVPSAELMGDSPCVSEVADSLQQDSDPVAPIRKTAHQPARHAQFLGQSADQQYDSPARTKGVHAADNPRYVDTPLHPRSVQHKRTRKLGPRIAPSLDEAICAWPDSDAAATPESGTDTLTPLGRTRFDTPASRSTKLVRGSTSHPETVLYNLDQESEAPPRNPFDAGVQTASGVSLQQQVREWCDTALAPTLKQFFSAGKHAVLTDPMAKKSRNYNPFAEGGLVDAQLKALLQKIETRRLWLVGTGKLPAASTRIPLSVHQMLVEFSKSIVNAVSQSSSDTEAKMMPLVSKLDMLSRQLEDASKHTAIIDKTWKTSTEDVAQFSELTTKMALEAHRHAHDWKKLQQPDDTDIKALASALSKSLHSAVAGSQRQQPSKRRREEGDGERDRPSGSAARLAGSEFEPAAKATRVSKKLFESRGLSEDTIPSESAARELWFKIVPCRAHLNTAKGCFRGDARCVYSHRWTLRALEQAGATRADLAHTGQS